MKEDKCEAFFYVLRDLPPNAGEGAFLSLQLSKGMLQTGTTLYSKVKTHLRMSSSVRCSVSANQETPLMSCGDNRETHSVTPVTQQTSV